MENLTEEQIQLAERFQEDFSFRAKNSLFIKSSSGQIKPLKLNRAQIYVHEKLEEQKQKQGYVRAVIVKARKEGISTLVAARYFDNIIRNEGQRAFILAHLESATSELYDMVDVLYKHYPPMLRPPIKESNAKRLFFENNSGYSVATAGSGEVGRGATVHSLHMSEVASYENGGNIIKGLMQAVYDLPGTEIIIESTAKGKDNIFYDLSKMAASEKSDYQLIFLPWFLLDEYRAAIPENFILTEEEEQVKLRFKLDDEQMAWRRKKINGPLGPSGFMNEFPATIEEAFQATAIDKLIPNSDVLEARNNFEITDTFRKPIIGVDPAGSGKDKTVITCRRGRHQYKSLTFEKLNTQQIVEQVINVIRSEKPAKVFIDKGYNPGIYDRLVELGYGAIVIGVQFGGEADEPLKYGNKRAEMYFRVKNWFADKPVRIQDDEELQVEICAIGVKDSGGRNKIYLQDKKEIREAIGRSPDKADALALTFAYNVATYEDLNYDEEDEREEAKILQGRNKVTGY